MTVIAGYEADINRFLAMNEGLASRYDPHQLRLLHPEDLVKIADVMAGDLSSLYSAGAQELLLTQNSPL